MNSLIGIMVFGVAFNCLAKNDVLPEAKVNKIVNAIYKIENSAKYPFGIKSIPLKGGTQTERKKYARKICRNTVINSYSKWINAGRAGNYLDSLAERYCAESVDSSGHRNWQKNIHKIVDN